MKQFVHFGCCNELYKEMLINLVSLKLAVHAAAFPLFPDGEQRWQPQDKWLQPNISNREVGKTLFFPEHMMLTPINLG